MNPFGKQLLIIFGRRGDRVAAAASSARIWRRGGALKGLGALCITLVLSTAASAQKIEPRWETDQKTGCKLWNPNPAPGESVSWSGACREGHADGYGVEQWFKDGNPGNRIEGEFVSGRSKGRVRVTYPNGAVYVGELDADGNQYGQGTLTSANGNKYVGEFHDGKRHGQGTYTFANGDKYVGEWREGKQHGQGTSTFASGNKYAGDYRDGKRHGQGTQTFASGSKYVGEFRDGKQHGQGTYTGAYTDANGYTYVGEFRDDKRHGQGTYTFANGDKYVGEWREGKQHGQGTLTYANGSKQIGYWREGTYVGATPPPNYQPLASAPLIAAIQTLLSALGFDPGAADGVNGPQTARAISAFQLVVGDTPDGQPSEAIRAKLVRVLAERGISPSPRAAEPKKPPNEVVSSGTGFFIQRDILVTNQHVIEGCAALRISRGGLEIGSARVIATRKSDDLAALKSDKPTDAYLELRAGSPLKPAESVLVFGYPLSGALSSSGNTTLGNVTALTGLQDDSREFQISAAIQPGNSGGPVLARISRMNH